MVEHQAISLGSVLPPGTIRNARPDIHTEPDGAARAAAEW